MSWPWKKKSSDKAAVEKVAAILDSAGATLAPTRPLDDQEKYKKPDYVQISLESYSHLTGLEDRVKTFEEQVQTLETRIEELNEKLSASQLEATTKENIVKQHSKVAEEAVSGWEKAEAEALALKNHLESVTLDKLTAEDRASHLDGALKECMKQIRNLKEEHEKDLQEVVLIKTKQLEKIKHEFEAKISDLDQELLKSATENDALSRSLQERSNMLIKLSEEKAQAEDEIEMLKSNVEACEREINSLKYELHVVSKELEIRNEEKNMSARSAEVANKQHMEGVKKIAKLEAECQRLRGLVRKKLPGPAALAQMKLEVESLGQDYHADSNLRRSPVNKPSNSRMPSSTDYYSFGNYQKFHKENDFLTERLLAMEEETKMLKEALAKRNSELQASRTMCAETTSKLQVLEAELQSCIQKSPESFVRVSTMSEDGNDDGRSCVESWPSASVSEHSQFNMEKSIDRPKNADVTKHLELMDDFLEMEKLACSSNDFNGVMSSPDSTATKQPDNLNNDASPVKYLDFPEIPPSSTGKLTLANLESRILMIFKSISTEDNIDKILEGIKQVVFDVCNSSQEHLGGISVSEEKSGQDSPGEVATLEKNLILSADLEAAIIQIHDFVLFLGKEGEGVQDMTTDSDELDQKIELFSATYRKIISSDASLSDFVLDLSHVLAKASDLKFNVHGYKGAESGVNSPDYIDKVALPENNEVSYQNGHGSSSYIPEVSDDGILESGDEANVNKNTVLLEGYEKLRFENDRMTTQLAKSHEDLEAVKAQLQETEQLLAEAKSQLDSAEKSHGLAETQLKCMAESYRSLEMRAQELETEVNVLREKTQSLSNELQEEKKAHLEALDRSKDLQDQLDRIESRAQESDADLKSKQETELAAASEKLAECQNTIFLLGKQLSALRPPSTETMGSPRSEKSRNTENLSEYRLASAANNLDRTGAESPMNLYSYYPGSPCPSEPELGLLRSPLDSKRSKHRTTQSGSLTSCSTPDRQSRGFSRFFSSKGKNSAYY